jgi:Ca-activated chloride channel family protein
MNNFQFYSPYWFFALLIIPILIYFRKRKKTKINNAVIYPNFEVFAVKKTILDYLPLIYFINKMLISSLLIIALARPQHVAVSEESIDKNGIDIILSVDVSLSMLARDMLPDRLSVLKDVAKKFVLNRKVDRIGYVVYAAEGLTKVPLTSDKRLLVKHIEETKTGELEQGTAIGMGLATAINHLKNTKTKSKVIILMTDGVNNSGAIDPLLATEIAKEKNIKVYTIGIGTNGLAEMPTSASPLTGELIYTSTEVKIDEDLLKNIANSTGGKYFRAQNESELIEIYQTIDSLEKSKIDEEKQFLYTEYFRIFLFIALLLFCLELISKLFIFKTIY